MMERRSMEIRDHCDSGSCEECRQAVLRTYSELRQLGQVDHVAFRGAVRLYALRHPSLGLGRVIQAVSTLLAEAEGNA